MIWNEMVYNKLNIDSVNNLDVEPEELDEYYKQNKKLKEEDFDGIDQTNTFVLN